MSDTSLEADPIEAPSTPPTAEAALPPEPTPNPENKTLPEKPQTEEQALVFDLVDHIKTIEEKRRKAEGFTYSPQEIAVMKGMSFSELNQHLVALVEEKVRRAKKKYPQGYKEGDESQPFPDSSKEKTIEDFAKESPEVTEQIWAAQDELYGENGIMQKALADMNERPEDYGLTKEMFEPGTTLSEALKQISQVQAEHAFRIKNKLSPEEKLTEEQQAELSKELQDKDVAFQEQVKTLEDKAKEFGVDLFSAGWNTTDFSTILQTLFAMDAYSNHNGSIFTEGKEKAGKTAVGAVLFKDMIGWKDIKQSGEAQKKWMKAFHFIAKHLPETQRNKLGDIEAWKEHHSKNEIMEDMHKFYEVIMTSSDPQALVDQAFTKASEDPEAGFSRKFDKTHYVSKELITFIEMIGKRGEDFDRFFGNVGVQQSNSAEPAESAAPKA